MTEQFLRCLASASVAPCRYQPVYISRLRCPPKPADKRIAPPDGNRGGDGTNQFRTGVAPTEVQRISLRTAPFLCARFGPYGSKIRHMKPFHTGREAKEFLVSKIVAEAQRENAPLSEVERKMLYFTESGWTLPDIMKVSADFDREYDQDEYEQKIAKLVTKTYRRISKGSRDEYDRWRAAIRFLEREDHYLTVMIRMAGLRPRGDQLRLFAAGLGIAICMLMWAFLSVKYKIPMPSLGDLEMLVLAVIACLFIGYLFLRFILGRKRIDDLTAKTLGKLSGIYKRVSGTA
jgi:hypothetical protein